jgi:DNA-damage-inducible protein J
MAQTAFTVRMDADVKKRFDELCKDFGMSSNTAFNMFARAVIKSERIPFNIESEEQAFIERARRVKEQIVAQAILNGTADMSMEEINEEIRLARQERRARMAAKEEE